MENQLFQRASLTTIYHVKYHIVYKFAKFELSLTLDVVFLAEGLTTIWCHTLVLYDVSFHKSKPTS